MSQPNASQRVAKRRARIQRDGGRALYVILEPKAAASLERLRQRHGSITRAVEAALELAAERVA